MHVAAATSGSETGSPYQILLGAAFAALHPDVQRAHLAPLAAEGTLDVEHGAGWSGLLIHVMNLPGAGRGQRVRLDVTPIGAEVEWTRRIGPSVLRTRQRAIGSLLVEHYGGVRIAFALDVENGALVYRQIWMRAAGVAIPSSVSPRVSARVSPEAGGWRVEVTVTWRGRLVCRYAGALGPV